MDWKWLDISLYALSVIEVIININKQMTRKNTRALSEWQLSENKPNTKLVLLSIEFNKPNK